MEGKAGQACVDAYSSKLLCNSSQHEQDLFNSFVPSLLFDTVPLAMRRVAPCHKDGLQLPVQAGTCAALVQLRQHCLACTAQSPFWHLLQHCKHSIVH